MSPTSPAQGRALNLLLLFALLCLTTAQDEDPSTSTDLTPVSCPYQQINLRQFDGDGHGPESDEATPSAYPTNPTASTSEPTYGPYNYATPISGTSPSGPHTTTVTITDFYSTFTSTIIIDPSSLAAPVPGTEPQTTQTTQTTSPILGPGPESQVPGNVKTSKLKTKNDHDGSEDPITTVTTTALPTCGQNETMPTGGSVATCAVPPKQGWAVPGADTGGLPVYSRLMAVGVVA